MTTFFAREADLRLRLRSLIIQDPDAADVDVANQFLDSLSDDEYNDLLTEYVAAQAEQVRPDALEMLARKQRRERRL